MKKVILIILFFLPISAFAQSVPKYVQIVNIPNVNPGDINTYMNSLYVLAITIAALLAVIKIVIAGVKWMTTDIVTSKGDAKKDIQGALLGLLIILSVVLIIEVINPDIGTVDLELEVVDVPEPPGGIDDTPLPFFIDEPINLETATPAQTDAYVRACLTQSGNHSYSSYVLDGVHMGSCVDEGGPVAIASELTTPQAVADFTNLCNGEGQVAAINPLPSGDQYGQCIECPGGQRLSPTENRCIYYEVTCDDSVDIHACDDITFDAAGNFILGPSIILGGEDSLTFSCDYADTTVFTACSTLCYANGGGLAFGDYCIIPGTPAAGPS